MGQDQDPKDTEGHKKLPTPATPDEDTQGHYHKKVSDDDVDTEGHYHKKLTDDDNDTEGHYHKK